MTTNDLFTPDEAHDLATRIRVTHPLDGLDTASDADTLAYHRDKYASDKSDAEWFETLESLPRTSLIPTPSGGFKQIADALPKWTPAQATKTVPAPQPRLQPRKHPALSYDERVSEAWLKHVSRHLRNELVSDGIPGGASDDDVVRYYRDMYAPDAGFDEFNQFLSDSYGHSFKAPSKSVREKAGEVARGLKAAAPSMGQQLVGQVGAQTASGLAKRSVWRLGAPILGGAYVARLAAQIHGAKQLAELADSIPAPDVTALQKHYFESLAPSLMAKGYTTQHIAKEVQRRVRNVVRGYVDTQNSLMRDIETTSQDMIASAAEGIANVGLLGYGGGFFKNALLSGARRAAGQKAANAISNTVAGRLVGHAVEGAAIGATYGATTGAVEAGARAAHEGMPIAPALGHGAISGGVNGGVGGAIVAGPLGAAIETIGSKAIADAAKQTPEPPSTAVVPGLAVTPTRNVASSLQPPQFGRRPRRESTSMQAARPHLERRKAIEFLTNLERELRRAAAARER